MAVMTDLRQCSGSKIETIAITYDIPSAVQALYHATPGQYHGGKFVTAYLPASQEGHALLKRLKYAFCNGLTFTVGTSSTTGIPNQCTWASIRHKTRRGGGVHGYPDPHYFDSCNGELDALQVPAA